KLSFVERIGKIFIDMNKKGIPIPLARDDAKDRGCVALTLVWISSVYVQLALLNSIANIFKGVDIVNALYWHGMCLALYYGRSYKKDGNKVEMGGKVSLSDTNE